MLCQLALSGIESPKASAKKHLTSKRWLINDEEASLSSFSHYNPQNLMPTSVFVQWLETKITRRHFIWRPKTASSAWKKQTGGLTLTTLLPACITCEHGPWCDAWQNFSHSPSALSRLNQPQGCPLLFLSTLTTRDLGRKQVVCLSCCWCPIHHHPPSLSLKASQRTQAPSEDTRFW